MNFFDIPVFNFINQTISNPLLNVPMIMVSYLGEGAFLFGCSFLMLFFRKKETKILGMSLIAGLTVVYYIVTALKLAVGRPRPFLVLPNAIMVVAEKTFSFPSGHAAAALMASALLSWRFKHSSRLFYFLAFLVCISRIYLGVHYPSDVLAGTVVGLAIGLFLVRINESLLDSRVVRR